MSPAKPPPDVTIPMGHVLEVLAQTYPTHPMSDVTGCDPYKVLVACLMSLRTRDETTFPLAEKLFQKADTPQKMVAMSIAEIERAIYPVGFYKTKARNLHALSQRLIDDFGGRVPEDIETLTTFKGVGRKTANLVVGLGYNKPAVCVDTHVHRICNRLGYLTTRTPEETEQVLRQKLDPRYWNILNKVLVRHGQECCKPIGPQCPQCPIEAYCAQRNVTPKKTATPQSRSDRRLPARSRPKGPGSQPET